MAPFSTVSICIQVVFNIKIAYHVTVGVLAGMHRRPVPTAITDIVNRVAQRKPVDCDHDLCI